MSLLVLALFSCSKESDIVTEMDTKGFSRPRVFNDILQFNNQKELHFCLENLNSNNQLEIQNYINSILGYEADTLPLTDLELESLDSSIVVSGFEGVATFENFESEYSGYQSLRAFVEPLVYSYMLSGNEDLDPNIRYPYSEEQKTILNKYEEIIIGDTIYKMIQNGQTLIKTHVNFYNSIVNIRTNEELAFSDSLIFVVYDLKSDCKSFKNNSENQQYLHGTKKYRIKSYCSIVFGYLTAITNHYRVHNNGSLTWSVARIQTGLVTSELYKSPPCNSNKLANLYNKGDAVIYNGVGQKLKSPITWFYQSVIIGDGVSWYFTKSQKTYSVTSCSSCGNSGIYIYSYAW